MGTKKLIVVVDDEPNLCELLHDLLDDAGYDVRCASDGAEALALLQSLDRRPCMVICDLIMPVMDGEDLLRATRADPGLCDLPFLFMSTDPSRAPSGHPFLTKPADLDVILRAAEQCCGSSVSVAS